MENYIFLKFWIFFLDFYFLIILFKIWEISEFWNYIYNFQIFLINKFWNF